MWRELFQGFMNGGFAEFNRGRAFLQAGEDLRNFRLRLGDGSVSDFFRQQRALDTAALFGVKFARNQ